MSQRERDLRELGVVIGGDEDHAAPLIEVKAAYATHDIIPASGFDGTPRWDGELPQWVGTTSAKFESNKSRN